MICNLNKYYTYYGIHYFVFYNEATNFILKTIYRRITENTPLCSRHVNPGCQSEKTASSDPDFVRAFSLTSPGDVFMIYLVHSPYSGEVKERVNKGQEVKNSQRRDLV